MMNRRQTRPLVAITCEELISHYWIKYELNAQCFQLLIFYHLGTVLYQVNQRWKQELQEPVNLYKKNSVLKMTFHPTFTKHKALGFRSEKF